MGVDARGFPGGLLRLDPAFAYVEPPSSWPLPRAKCLTLAPNTRDSPGKNTGVGCHALLQGSSWPRDRTCILNPHLMSSALAGGFFTTSARLKAMCSQLISILIHSVRFLALREIYSKYFLDPSFGLLWWLIVLLLISPFILVSICLTYCGAPTLGAYIFIIVISSSWIDPLIIM